MTTPPNPLVAAVRNAYHFCLNPEETPLLYTVGLSGRRYRVLINHLIHNLPHPRYLEIGLCTGSTFFAALYNNTLTATAVDNWSEFDGSRQLFLENLKNFKTPLTEVTLYERDFRKVDYEALGPFDVYMFDGPHEEHDQYDAIKLVAPALSRHFVLIVDDWNWDKVRAGTLAAIQDLKMNWLLSLQIRTTMDGTQLVPQDLDWHNGYLIAVLEH